MIVVIFDEACDHSELDPRCLTHFCEDLHEISPCSRLVSQNIECCQLFVAQTRIEPENISI